MGNCMRSITNSKLDLSSNKEESAWRTSTCCWKSRRERAEINSERTQDRDVMCEQQRERQCWDSYKEAKQATAYDWATVSAWVTEWHCAETDAQRQDRLIKCSSWGARCKADRERKLATANEGLDQEHEQNSAKDPELGNNRLQQVQEDEQRRLFIHRLHFLAKFPLDQKCKILTCLSAHAANTSTCNIDKHSAPV